MNASADPIKRTSRAARWWIAIAATVLLTVVGFVVVRTQGFVSGSEFSPTHFQQREFSFYEIPLLHLQITPIRRAASTPATANYVRQNALIRAASGPATVWHLASLSRGLSGSTPADAGLLLDQLELASGGNEYWRKWSIDHPPHAKLLWPVVQQLAERELYVLTPRLFELAQPEQSPAQLRETIDEYLKQQYRDLIADLRAAGRETLADGLRQEALQDYPDATFP